MIRSEYNRVHNWIKKQKGKPTHCEACGFVPYPANQLNALHWSNISDNYKYDVSDWQMLCPSCHYKFDAERISKKQAITLLAKYGTPDMYEVLDVIAGRKFVYRLLITGAFDYGI